jgi:hypothetical protein
MRDPDLELRMLEDEYPASLKALHTQAPKKLTDRVIAAARSSALQLAAGRPVEEHPFPRFIPTRMRDKDPKTMFSRSASLKGRAPRSRFPSKADHLDADDLFAGNMSFEASDSALVADAMHPYPDEAGRLVGRDRETWLQRIAELSLQGNLREADWLIRRFDVEFG